MVTTFLYRAMPCIARTMFSQDACLSSPVRQSVCLSHAGMLSKQFNIMITPFSPDRHIVLVFAAPNIMAVFRWDHLTEPLNAGCEKINRNFRPISRYMSEIIQDTAIVTIADE